MSRRAGGFCRLIRGAVNTRLLTSEGVLNGEFESLGAFIRGTVKTMMVLLEPSESDFGMEDFL